MAGQHANSATLLRLEDEIESANPVIDYLLVDGRSGRQLALGEFEAEVWELLSQGKLPEEISAIMTMRTGRYEDSRVDALISQWRKLGFLGVEFANRRPLWRRLLWSEFVIPGFDTLLQSGYRFFGKYFFTRIALVATTTMILLGLISGLLLVMSNNVVPLRSLMSEGIVFVIVPLALVSVFLHEMGHAMAMSWARSKILRAGFALYFGLPVFFVDTSTSWAKSRHKRIIISGSGLLVNAIICAICALVIPFIQHQLVVGVLWELIFVNLFQISYSLIPFIKSDSYYILVDVLGMPNLNRRAMNGIKSAMKGVRAHSRPSIGLLIYGLLSMLFSLLLVTYAILYWWGISRVVLP